MTFQEILDKLKTKVEVVESKEDLGILNAVVDKRNMKSAVKFLKEEMKFDLLNFTTAIDRPADNCIEAIYRLYGNESHDSVVIRVKLDRSNPEIETVSDIFRTADWHERETSEMFGIKYKGHPDPRKLLLTEDIINPLRKDFTHPDQNPLPKV
jgi:NADH-quinone oxidoreductase subunit C